MSDVLTYMSKRPTKPFVVYVAGGHRRQGDYTAHMDKLSQQKVQTIIVDPLLGGHMHNVMNPKCFDWVMELVAHPQCIAALATPPCGPWCIASICIRCSRSHGSS